MPQGNGQPVPPADPHSRLLVDLEPARLGAANILLARGSVRHDPALSHQGRRLIKVAGRVTEMVTRIKIALPSAFPYQAGFANLAGRIAKLPP
jgi:hypothetical protein